MESGGGLLAIVGLLMWGQRWRASGYHTLRLRRSQDSAANEAGGIVRYTVPMEAILAGVQPYDIHGTHYFRIIYATKTDPDRMTEGRVAAEGIYRGAKAGDRVEIRMLLGVIDDVKLMV